MVLRKRKVFNVNLVSKCMGTMVRFNDGPPPLFFYFVRTHSAHPRADMFGQYTLYANGSLTASSSKKTGRSCWISVQRGQLIANCVRNEKHMIRRCAMPPCLGTERSTSGGPYATVLGDISLAFREFHPARGNSGTHGTFVDAHVLVIWLLISMFRYVESDSVASQFIAKTYIQ